MSSRPFSQKGAVVERLMALCDRLRGEDGCAWDREQTLSTLTPYLLEEVHEVLEATGSGDREAIREELGDLLFVTLFALHAAEVEGIGSVEEIIDGTHEKLVRRHPHVFGDAPSDDPKHAREQWQKAKRAEGKVDEQTVLGRYPDGVPAPLAAFRLQEKAAAVGFDWPDVAGPLDKVGEELEELRDVIDGAEAESELGDLLFAVANVARFLRVDPEVALKRANRRFYDRFRHIERRLREEDRGPEDATLDEMETLWQEAKGASTRDPDDSG